jgi:hypothetical protein
MQVTHSPTCAKLCGRCNKPPKARRFPISLRKQYQAAQRMLTSGHKASKMCDTRPTMAPFHRPPNLARFPLPCLAQTLCAPPPAITQLDHFRPTSKHRHYRASRSHPRDTCAHSPSLQNQGVAKILPSSLQNRKSWVCTGEGGYNGPTQREGRRQALLGPAETGWTNSDSSYKHTNISATSEKPRNGWRIS